MTRSPVICVGFVLDATTRLAMGVSLAVWVQFGIRNASDVLLATSPYQSMRYESIRVVFFFPFSVLQIYQLIDDNASLCSLLCMMISRTTNPATKSFFIQNVMSATTL